MNTRLHPSQPAKWRRSRGLLLVAAAVWALLSLPAAAAPGPPRFPPPEAAAEVQGGTHGVIIAAQPHAGRFLRGDHEPIDLLMLVHDESWSESVDAIIERVADTTPVEVLLQDAASQGAHYASVPDGRCVSFSEVPHDTPWIRDYGPLQVSQDGRTAWVDLDYGIDRDFDDGVPEVLGERFGRDVAYEHAQIDGGGIVSNGRGLCAITEMSVLESGLAIEGGEPLREFARRIGCPALAVVPMLPDEQTGHADVTIQFLSESKVAVAWMAPSAYPLHSALLDQTAEILEFAAERIGQPLEVVRVPMTARGEVFYSYLNGTRVGDVFLVPSYANADPAYQDAAYGVLAAHMPGVALAPIPADNMVELGGAIHCITLGLSLPPTRKPRCGPQRLVKRRPSRGAPPAPIKRAKGS